MIESDWFSSNEGDVLVPSKHGEHLLIEAATNSVPVEDVQINAHVKFFQPVQAIRNPHPNRLLTVGTMSWPSNYEGVLWWLRGGYEYLQAICLDISYDIVGTHPPFSLQQVVSQYEGVRLHSCTTNVESFWTCATVLCVPFLTAGSIQLNILKAMALGVPVISTTVGCEGLAVSSGKHLLVADTPETLALACAMVLRDKKLAFYLVRNAHQFLLEHYHVTC